MNKTLPSRNHQGLINMRIEMLVLRLWIMGDRRMGMHKAGLTL
jgi:hypothetical protein